MNSDHNNSKEKHTAALDELLAEFRAGDQPNATNQEVPQNVSVSSSQNPPIIMPPTVLEMANQETVNEVNDIAPQDQPVNMRTAQDFSKAQRHSTWVKRFKLLFPIAACLIVAVLVTFSLFYRQIPENISVDGAALSDGKLVMDGPNLDGFDDKNRPYSVKANRAIQDLKNTDVINLEGIQADLPIDDKNFAKVDAVKGTYDNKKQLLKLNEEIILNSSNGYIITLQEADIDIQKGELISNAPVSVDSPSGKISAQALEITDNGKRIVFKKKVKLLIQPSN